MGRAAIEGWVTLDAAKNILKMAGQDFDALKKQAASRDFKPVPLGLTASMAIGNTLRTIESHNVVAKLEGSDPALKDEYVVYSAHWDHLGVGRAGQGRQDLQRRARQRVGRRDRARDRPRVHRGEAGAETLDPVPDGHRGGAGIARVAVPTRSLRSTRSPRRWRTSTSTASTNGAAPRTSPSSVSARQTSTTTCATPPPSRTAPCAPIRNRRKASTTGPITSTSPSRECRRSIRTRASSTSASRPSTANRSATITRRTTTTAVRRSETGLGSQRRRRGCRAVPRGRLPSGERGQVPRVEGRERVQSGQREIRRTIKRVPSTNGAGSRATRRESAPRRPASFLPHARGSSRMRCPATSTCRPRTARSRNRRSCQATESVCIARPAALGPLLDLAFPPPD